MDKDVDHIGSDWHTKSKKKCSPKKKGLTRFSVNKKVSK
jgi:hypothetical protein